MTSMSSIDASRSCVRVEKCAETALMAFQDRWGDQGEGAHAPGRDFAVQVRDLVHVQAEDVRDGGQVDDSFGAEGGEFGSTRATSAGSRM